MPHIIHPSSYEILGIGTPIVDHVLRVSHDFLAQLPGIKGGSISIDYPHLEALLQQGLEKPTLVIGGSATNTIKGLASLGRRCALFGKVGADEAGQRFRHEIEQLGIIPHLLAGKLPTAQVACLVSPDSERTMRSFLGAGTEMRPEDLTPEMFKGVAIVHIEGYILAYGDLTRRAMELAKQAGAKISFDVSSVEITQQHTAALYDLITSHVDILFANEDETLALTGQPAEQGCEMLRNLCEIAVVKMGKHGNWAASKDIKIYQPAFDVHTLDSTGAGDLFASGFLHGYLSKLNLEQCSKYGALVASEVVQIIGADIPTDTWQAIKHKIL